MSSDLESRLTKALLGLPGSSDESERAARRAALAAVPRERPRRRLFPRRTLALAAALAILLAAGAAALAAIGHIEVRLGAAKHPAHRPTPTQLALPHGANGFSVFAAGRLWLATREGVQIQGLGASAVALSPRALYVAVGLESQLVAMAPNRHQAWAHPTRGSVVAAAWSPDGLKIAYVVARPQFTAPRGNELHVIEGDGDHDQLIDAGVSAVTPSWRADALAFAYVGAGGRAIVYDLGHRSRRVLVPPVGCGAVRHVAFAPAGRALALLSRSRVLLDAGRPRLACSADPGVATYSDLVWISESEFVASGRPSHSQHPYLRRWLVLHGHVLGGGAAACTPSPVVALSASPSSGRLAIAMRDRAGLQIEELRASSKWGDCPEVRTRSPLLRVSGGPRRAQLAWR